MIKNITREIEPKIDKGIKLILIVTILNLLFATLMDTFLTQWIINSIFCALILFEFFTLNKNLDFIYLLDIKKEDIYNNLMINYFKISILLLTFTWISGMRLFNDYFLGMSLIFPIFIFITSFLLEYILTRKKTSIIKYLIIATIYFFLMYYIATLFWISMSYIFIKVNSFIISQKKDYKFIKNNLFLNFSILLYSSMFLFYSVFPHFSSYYNSETEMINYVYNYNLVFSYGSIVLFFIGVFIAFVIYYYFKKKYNLQAKNKLIDVFFLTLTYILLVIKIFSIPFVTKYDVFNNIIVILEIKIFLSIILLILIFISSKIYFKPKKLGEIYDKYL